MQSITLLDGGVGQEIYKRAPNNSHPLWSVKVMFDAPQIVVDVHDEFIQAGASIVCLNTYTATPTRIARDGFGVSLKEIHDTAIKLAKQAIARSGKPYGNIKIAGCLPPLVASYVAKVSQSYQASLDEYRQLVALQASAVDLFMIETMSNTTEATAAMVAAKESGKPVFLGLTVSDSNSKTLRSGECLNMALAKLIPKEPDTILLNCSTPEAITEAMPMLAHCEVPFGGYANGFTNVDTLLPGGTVDTLSARTDLSPENYAKFAMNWVSQGATIIGGCCEVSPKHIAYLKKQLLEHAALK